MKGWVCFLKGDMIEVLKMIHGMDNVNLGKLFCIDEDRIKFKN